MQDFLFLYRIALGALQNFLADGFDFQAGNFTWILRMDSFEDISVKSFVATRKGPEEQHTAVKKEVAELSAKKSLLKNRLYCQCCFSKDNDLFLCISSTSTVR